jgi:hypothetical protein
MKVNSFPQLVSNPFLFPSKPAFWKELFTFMMTFFIVILTQHCIVIWIISSSCHRLLFKNSSAWTILRILLINCAICTNVVLLRDSSHGLMISLSSGFWVTSLGTPFDIFLQWCDNSWSYICFFLSLLM